MSREEERTRSVAHEVTYVSATFELDLFRSFVLDLSRRLDWRDAKANDRSRQGLPEDGYAKRVW
jgi:hypothetical protein